MLLKSTISALVSRGIGLLLQLILTMLLGRLLGAAGMGMYSLYNAWMMMLASVTDLGTPNHVMRNVSVLEAESKRQQAIRFTLRITKILLLTGLAVCLLVWLVQPVIEQVYQVDRFEMDWLLLIAASSAVFFMLIRIFSVALKGLNRVNLALICETALWPLGALLVLGLIIWFDWDFTAQQFLLLHLVLLVVVSLFMFGLLLRFKRLAAENQNTDSATTIMDKSLLPLWGSGLLNMWFLNMPVLLLPQFASAEEIGVFGVAFRLIALTSVVLVTLASLFGPRFACAYANDDVDTLRKNLKQSQFFSLIIFLPMLVMFALFGDFILGLFGEEFRQGLDLLLVMAIGQLINAATGLVGFMMNMMRQEKQEFYIQLFMSLVLLTLIFALGLQYGVFGVALAYAIAIALKNIISLLFSLYYLNAMQRMAGAIS